jgi:CBS domain-containing protein
MIPLGNVPLLAEDMTAVEALTALSSPTSNRGLVVENGQLAGLLSVTDLARALEVRNRPRPAAAEALEAGR